MLSSIKWSLSASPSGILLQRCSSAGCFWYLLWFHCGSIPPPLVNLLSSRTEDHIQKIVIPVFHFGRLAMNSFGKNICVCVSVQRGLKAQFWSMQETGSCKTSNMKCCPTMASLHIPSFMFFHVNQKQIQANPLILDQNSGLFFFFLFQEEECCC